MRAVRAGFTLFLLLAAGGAPPAPAQSVAEPVEPAKPLYPPRPVEKPDREEGDTKKKETFPRLPHALPESDAPWGIPSDLARRLAERVDLYRSYFLSFSCRETVREARYDENGEASQEKLHRFAYILVRNDRGLSEYRTRLRRDGTAGSSEVKDDSRFPPAPAWAFLFSRTNQPYFAYRKVGEHFEGFDWVVEIQFRGALPFTDGKDIRQWQGTVLLDASSWTPVEIRAEPSGQWDRLAVLFDRWSRSFNLMGFRTGPKPMVYHCEVQFRYRRGGLRFPTELRYDSYQAVRADVLIPRRASIRSYDRYRFFKVNIREKVDHTPKR